MTFDLQSLNLPQGFFYHREVICLTNVAPYCWQAVGLTTIVQKKKKKALDVIY